MRIGLCVMALAIVGASAERALAQTAAQTPNAGGPMRVEQVHDAWAIAPEFKVTHFDDGTRTLAGGYVARVVDNSLLFGFAGYGLLDGNHNRELSYGGLLVEWREGVDRRIGFSVRGLFGGGTATATGTIRYVIFPDGRPPIIPAPTPVTATAVFRHENFLVAEPEADLLLNLSSHVRVHAGAGYRFAGEADPIDHQIHGVVGSFSVEIGPHH